MRSHPFTASTDTHGGSDEEMSAARDSVALVTAWGVEGLLTLAQHHQELRYGPRPMIFTGDEQDPSPTAALHLDEGEAAILTFTLVGLGPDVTRFATKASTVIDGIAGDVYSESSASPNATDPWCGGRIRTWSLSSNRAGNGQLVALSFAASSPIDQSPA